MKGEELRRLVERSFDVIKERSTSEEVVFICPLPDCADESGNRSVNLKNGKTYCWRCAQGGNFAKWASYHQLGIDVTHDVLLPSEDMEKALYEKHRKETLTPIATNVSLPEGFTPLTKGRDSCYHKFISRMAQRKHLTIEDLEAVGAGFTKKDNLWEPYCIFPVEEYGRLVYYQGRTYVDVKDEPTKRFPSRKALPLGAGYWVYNLSALDDPEVSVAVVVESILNVLTLQKEFRNLGIREYAPVCVFKHDISIPQALKIGRYKNVKELVLLFDADAADKSYDIAAKRARLPMSIAKMPPTFGPKTDANDDPEGALNAIADREKYSSTSSLRVSLIKPRL